jgi:BASS family bile acid:Na+ symporter
MQQWRLGQRPIARKALPWRGGPGALRPALPAHSANSDEPTVLGFQYDILAHDPSGHAAGSEATAIVAFSQRLLASGSATRTLKAWCAEHRVGDGPVQAARHACTPEPPEAALLAALALAPGEALRHRRVTLIRGALALADCEVWWVPARLDPAMVEALEATATPFGAVTAPLRTARRTLFATALPADPAHLLEHRAVLVPAGATRPIAALRERYRRTLLTARAGQHGPALLCLGVLLGIALPPLAEMARPWMGLAVFILTLGALLRLDGPAFRTELACRRTMLAVLAWTVLGVPLLAFATLRLLQPDRDVALALLLTTMAPPISSAAAIAAMLGISAPVALLASVAATLAAPLTLPPLAALLAGTELELDPLALALRLGAIVGGAALTAWLLRRLAGRWVAQNPQAMTGICVLGLLLLGLGAMRGLGEEIVAAPERALLLLGLALLANAALQVAGAMVFAGLGRRRALAVGLVSGNRNTALVWAAAAPLLVDRPVVELTLAMTIIAIFIMPALTRRGLAALLARDATPRIEPRAQPARQRP